ncbi:hypothetical protein GUJ93_ZPchr0001g32527 [Zizania palustris]|uniref:Uncharacterized protein n=1 Tax=Zizania palustris TaxID=103762 RepID=A0A8J5SH62_ZIZPA|nr:hypothetical protein GUJ93_ZPchr0001g32527 [Zizania palustris]
MNRGGEPRMERAVQLPQYLCFDLSGEDLRCYILAPAMENSGVPCDTLQVIIGLEGLPRTRLSRPGIAATRPADEIAEATVLCDLAQIGGGGGDVDDDEEDDPDTVSDAGTSGVGVAEETAGSDEVASLDELLFFDEGFVRKIDALAELVGMEGGCTPAAVLGEVVRVIQDSELKMGRSVCATRAVRS